jgi:hypothetical protein
MRARTKRRLHIGLLPKSVCPWCDPAFAVDHAGHGQAFSGMRPRLNGTYKAAPRAIEPEAHGQQIIKTSATIWTAAGKMQHL